MGCFLLMETLRVMARLGFDEVFAKVNAILLLSPDIEIDVFRKQAPPVLARDVPIFVVVSTRDRALLMSAMIRAERSTPRVGSISSPEELGDARRDGDRPQQRRRRAAAWGISRWRARRS